MREGGRLSSGDPLPPPHLRGTGLWLDSGLALKELELECWVKGLGVGVPRHVQLPLLAFVGIFRAMPPVLEVEYVDHDAKTVFGNILPSADLMRSIVERCATQSVTCPHERYQLLS